MEVGDALRIVGCKRVVWIDDKFNITPEQVAELLWRKRELAIACAFPEFEGVFEKAAVDEGVTKHEHGQKLTDLQRERVIDIRNRFLEREAETEGFAAEDLTEKRVEQVCRLLDIKPDVS